MNDGLKPELVAKLSKFQQKMAKEATVVIKQAQRTASLRSNIIGKTIVSSTGRCYR